MADAPKNQGAVVAPKPKEGPSAPPAAKDTKPLPGKPAVPIIAAPLPPPPVLQNRRSFLQWSLLAWFIFFTWLAGTFHLFLRFMFPRVLYEKDPRFMAGVKSDFPESNKVYERFKESDRVWIVRLAEEGNEHLVALSAICTHLGCTPNWLDAEKKFKCPCHGSGFYLSGINFEGPAPRPLERFRIFLDSANNVIVDKSRIFRKELNQWDNPDSYIKLT